MKGKHHDIYKVLKLLIIWKEYRCMAKSISLHLRYMLSIQSSTSKCKDNKLLKFFYIKKCSMFYFFFFFLQVAFFNLHFNLFSFSAWVLNHKKQNLCCELTSLDGKSSLSAIISLGTAKIFQEHHRYPNYDFEMYEQTNFLNLVTFLAIICQFNH